MPDPASLNLSVSVSGLAPDEAMTVFMNVPIGASLSAQVTKPAIGPKRFAIQIENLSIEGAKDLTTALFLHMQHVQESGAGS